MSAKPEKPLGHKCYGRIAHFEGSHTGQNDTFCEPNQQKVMTNRSSCSNYGGFIIVQEKLDGSNCAVAKVNGKIVALGRSGFLAKTSPFIQHQYFHNWVGSQIHRFNKLLNEGERVVGEWLIQAHGTRYKLIHEPFVVLDIMTKKERVVYHDFLLRVLPLGFTVPKLLHTGSALKLEHAKKLIQTSGHGSIDPVEGFVYRCEKEGIVKFLCKWVRLDKEDGKYLPEISGSDAIWNCDMKDFISTEKHYASSFKIRSENKQIS